MKKYFVFAAAALVALAACSKVEIDEKAIPDTKIAFEVASYASQTTKANTALEDESFEHFYTYANMFQPYGDPAAYMNNVEILYTNGTPKVWAPAQDYYWPKNTASYINFYSYVNTKPTGTGTLTPSVSFDVSTMKTATITYTDKVIESTDNILLADPALHQNGNLTNYTSISNVTSGVPTLFRHLIAKVSFTVKLQTDESKKSATNKFVVTILNAGANTSTLVAHQKGSFTATHTDVSTAATTGTWTMPNVWTPSETPQTETINMLTPELTLAVNTTSCDAQTLLAERTVMPQTLSATNAFNLAFRVDTYQGSAATPYMSEIIKFNGAISTLVSGITAWNKNTKYIYNIIIDPVSSKITFDPVVEEWPDPATSGTYNYPPAS